MPVGSSAERDLEWYYQRSASDVGWHAQEYQPTVQSSFDSNSLHVRLRMKRHRDAVERMARVEMVLSHVPVVHRNLLRLCYDLAAGPLEKLHWLEEHGNCIRTFYEAQDAALEAYDDAQYGGRNGQGR